MLFNAQGKPVQVGKLDKGSRVAALAPLREVLIPSKPRRNEGFSLGERARLKGQSEAV